MQDGGLSTGCEGWSSGIILLQYQDLCVPNLRGHEWGCVRVRHVFVRTI